MSIVNKLVAVFGVGVALKAVHQQGSVTYTQADGKGASLSFGHDETDNAEPGNYDAVVQGTPVDAADPSKGLTYNLSEKFKSPLEAPKATAKETKPQKAARQSPDIQLEGRQRF